jgi:hypothetical protein
MNKTLLAIVGSVFGAGLLILVMVVLGYVGFQNKSNRYENGIQAQYDENKNVFDNGFKKVLEAAQVTDKQADDLKDLYVSVAQGLKSPNLLMQALGQFNPQMDQSTYRKVQQLIESYHNDFQQRQTELISRKNEYKNYLTATLSGRIYNTVGAYPRIDLSKYDIVTSERTEDSFRTKKSEPLDIYKRKATPVAQQ